MPIHPLAGKPAPADMLIDVAALERAYYENRPDLNNPAQRVAFGTSGHRGTSLDSSFTEAHILATTQAICDYRRAQHITGPLFMGKDSHALSDAAQRTALEVLAANGVETFIQIDNGNAPTPVISRAILAYNRGRLNGLADGVVITPSHNPPADGGFKYNPPTGGPADTAITQRIQDRANELLRGGNKDAQRIAYEAAMKADTTHLHDYVPGYVDDVANAIDLAAIRSSGIKLGVDPLGGASLAYWEPLTEKYGLNLALVNPKTDPTFSFMTVDHDGKIRMDCSSPYAMASLVQLKDQFDIAWGNDPDADRHGIVTRSIGLMNPNHYLAVAIHYLLQHRPQWPASAAVGKTTVSSNLINRVVALFNRRLAEVPVGFKWFAPGLYDESICFGGEESAGASFLRRDGTVWTTDKDGLLMGLLAAEISAVTEHDPGEHYRALTLLYGNPYYTRIDAPTSPEQKRKLLNMSPYAVTVTELAGDPIVAKLTRVPGNYRSIGGLKIMTEFGWFAARPSGTENVYKLYAESFRSEEHLQRIVEEAQQIVNRSL
jgi:phosphoglucomutase